VRPPPGRGPTPNYHAGQAQILLAPALAAHPLLNVSTKTGNFNEATGTDVVNAGVLTEDEAAAGHSLAPDYVRWQNGGNRQQLGRDRLDLALLHNPERAHPATATPCTRRSGPRSRSCRKRPWPDTWPGTASSPGRARKRKRSQFALSLSLIRQSSTC
jgi:hypothetical protein